MGQYNVVLSFETIAIDIAGTFPVTVDENRYITDITVRPIDDYFTKWMDACAIPNHNF